MDEEGRGDSDGDDSLDIEVSMGDYCNTKTMVLYNFLTSARSIMQWVLILQFCIFRVTVCIRFSNFERLYTYINLYIIRSTVCTIRMLASLYTVYVQYVGTMS